MNFMGNKAIKLKDKDNNIIYPCPYFPIGSIYINVTNINPSNFFGGVWEQIQDVFLLACGNIFKNGSVGGEATHRLTVAEIPSHNHFYPSGEEGTQVNDIYGPIYNGNRNIYGSETRYTGGDQPHNNMPPYLAVYVWKRIK